MKGGTIGTVCLPPDEQMNFDDLSFAKTSGVSPSSSTSDGTMLQMSILIQSARDATRFILGMTPAGPKMQCRRKNKGITIFIMTPALFQGLNVVQISRCLPRTIGDEIRTWLIGNDEYILSPSFQSDVHGTNPPSPSVGGSSRTASVVPIRP